MGPRIDLLILIENCGGFAGSQRQFGGVHVRMLYILHPNDSSFSLSCVEFGEVVFNPPVSDCRDIAALVMFGSASLLDIIHVN
jgi:hypothetical protein